MRGTQHTAAVTQRALCHYIINYPGEGADDMALGRDLGHYMSYVMLDTFKPKAIFRQHRPFRPATEASAAHCCWPLPRTPTAGHPQRRAHAADDGEGGEGGEATVLKVPAEFATMADALAVPRDVKVVEIAGGSDVRWSGTVYTSGAPIHADLDMADLEADAPTRRLEADRLPVLQPQISHMLQHPALVTEREAEEIHMAHCARAAEPMLVTDEDLLLSGILSMRRPAPNVTERLVPCPDSLTMPRKLVDVHVRGPPNARLWGTWSLDKNCRGSFEGVTCALAR